MTKQDTLLAWIRQQPYVTSYSVKRYGQFMYPACMDPDKRCREWTKAGVLVHLTEAEKEKVGVKRKFVAWKYVGWKVTDPEVRAVALETMTPIVSLSAT